VTLLSQAFTALAVDHGGCPLPLYTHVDLEDIPQLVRCLDGIILIGGQDIDPALYGQTLEVEYSDAVRGFGSRFRRPASGRPDRRRDDMEIALYRAAVEHGMPVLGICRGLQIINVAEGGTLYQELPETNTRHHFEEDGFINHHEVSIEKDSLAYRLLETELYYTSSLHHQGIDRLGQGLRVSGRAPDGAPEIIESTDPGRWVIAVHGHMELTRVNLWRYENILAAFMARARDYRTQRA